MRTAHVVSIYYYYYEISKTEISIIFIKTREERKNEEKGRKYEPQ